MVDFRYICTATGTAVHAFKGNFLCIHGNWELYMYIAATTCGISLNYVS